MGCSVEMLEMIDPSLLPVVFLCVICYVLFWMEEIFMAPDQYVCFPLVFKRIHWLI